MHLDGFNLIPFLSGKEKESPREGFLYWSDDGDLMAIRALDYKVTFLTQDGEANPSDLHQYRGSPGTNDRNAQFLPNQT